MIDEYSINPVNMHISCSFGPSFCQCGFTLLGHSIQCSVESKCEKCHPDLFHKCKLGIRYKKDKNYRFVVVHDKTPTKQVNMNKTDTANDQAYKLLTINGWANKVHKTAVEHGWWEDNNTTFGDKITLMHTELSEAFEEFRNGRKYNEIYYKEGESHSYPKGTTSGTKIANKPEGIPVELADVVIRIMDFCAHEGIDLEAAIALKAAYNETRPYKHGNKKL